MGAHESIMPPAALVPLVRNNPAYEYAIAGGPMEQERWWSIGTLLVISNR